MQERGKKEGEGGPERPHLGEAFELTLASLCLCILFIPIYVPDAVQRHNSCTSVTEMRGLSGEENCAGDEFIVTRVTGASVYSRRDRARYFS